MKFALIFCMFVLLTSGKTIAYEGPTKNTYKVMGMLRLISCDSDTPPAFDIGEWAFGPANSAGKCIVDTEKNCNFPFAFVLFDNGKPYYNISKDQLEDDLCQVAGSWDSCAYVEVSLKSLPNGSDVVNVKTAITGRDQQRVTSANNYPIENFINQDRSFVGTANGCKRYELKVNVHLVK